MKLFPLIVDLLGEDIIHPSAEAIKKSLRDTGFMDAFEWTKRKEDFVKFILYFVHAYSFESKMMDTEAYDQSLKKIAENFSFDFESFKTSFGEDFNENYRELIAFYLESQKNREFELLITGTILYKQMLSNCTSKAITKKGKDDADINIDFDSKKKLFDSCLDINKELKMLEQSLYHSNKLIAAAMPEEEEPRSPREIRIENSLASKRG